MLEHGIFIGLAALILRHPFRSSQMVVLCRASVTPHLLGYVW